MTAGLDVRATVTPAWRDAAGRFARADAGGVLAKTVQAWGATAVRELREATPVRTGAARASWRADYLPSERSCRVSNARPYVPYLIRGTAPHGRHPGMRPNPHLAAAIERIEHSAAVDLHLAGVEIIRQLGQ